MRIKTRIASKQMEELDEIEKAMYQTSTILSSQGWNQSSWFEEHWKPKFDKIRSLMVEREVLNCPICNSTTGCKECLCCGQEKPE